MRNACCEWRNTPMNYPFYFHLLPLKTSLPFFQYSVHNLGSIGLQLECSNKEKKKKKKHNSSKLLPKCQQVQWGQAICFDREEKLRQFQSEAGRVAATGLKKQAAGKISSLLWRDSANEAIAREREKDFLQSIESSWMFSSMNNIG